MNKILIGWGVDPKIANTFDEAIIAVLMICIAATLSERHLHYLLRMEFRSRMPELLKRAGFRCSFS